MLAIITGSGFYDVPGLSDARDVSVDTPFGTAEVTVGSWQGAPIAFLARHGRRHTIPPHRINYRANLWALDELGAGAVLATAVSSGIADDLAPGDLVLIDQFLEFTRDRADTFFDRDDRPVRHTDMTEPYDRELRGLLADAAGGLDLVVRPSGVYACTNGPRLATPAEASSYARLGAELLGMTGYPEVSLAAELDLPYAAIGVIADLAPGFGPRATLEQIVGTLESVRPAVWALIGEVARQWSTQS